jgi:hypothetical protein
MRRGQAALEYIVTYGWGFLVIVVVLGVLAYFGLLSPSRYVPQRCDFGAQMQCVDYKLQNGNVYVQFRNNFGDDIVIQSIYLFDSRSPATVSVTSPVVTAGNVSNIFTVSAPAATLARGDRVNVPVIVSFARNIAGSPSHNVTGEIFATVH